MRTDPKINLHLGCSLQAMREMKDNQYDLAIVDPPYGINAGLKTSYGSRNINYKIQKYTKKNWDMNIPSKKYFDELMRVSKNQIIFGANYFTMYLPPKKGWIVWDKMIGDNHFSMHELIFTSMKIVPKIISISIEKNRVSNNRDIAKNKQRIHPTQKPIALYKWLLENYAKDGDKILDTHLGSGSIACACWDLGFDLDAWEIDKDYFEKTTERYTQYSKQSKLF